jgi:hypothetical protein
MFLWTSFHALRVSKAYFYFKRADFLPSVLSELFFHLEISAKNAAFDVEKKRETGKNKTKYLRRKRIKVEA